jgi:hypothetical protein
MPFHANTELSASQSTSGDPHPQSQKAGLAPLALSSYHSAGQVHASGTPVAPAATATNPDAAWSVCSLDIPLLDFADATLNVAEPKVF